MRVQCLAAMLLGFASWSPAIAEAKLSPDHQAIDVEHYQLTLDLDAAEAIYTGTVAVTFQVTEKGQRGLWLHADGLTIDAVTTADGTATLPFHHRKNRVEIAFPEKLTPQAPVTVVLAFHGQANARAQEGLFVVRTPGQLPAYYTQFEPQGARRVFPCYDEPFDKATTEVTIRADARYTLLSNGRKEHDVVQKGRRTVTFRNEAPISPYLITLVAAQLEAVERPYRSTKGLIPLTIYTAPGRSGDAQVAWHALQESMAFFEDYFGIPYPWEQHGMVAVEGFTWSGMENMGLANLNATALYWNPDEPYQKEAEIVALVAHELAHEWFGNLVTMQWWDDLWLNEAFATFMEQKVVAQVFGDDYVAIENFFWLEKGYFLQDRGPFSHPVLVENPATIEELIDTITYSKGVQVVRMLESLVGPVNFQRAMQSYMTTFQHRNATTADFFRTVTMATGVPLEHFAHQWLERSGFPWVEASYTWEEEDAQTVITLRQYDFYGRPLAGPFPGVINVAVIGDDYHHQIDVGVAQSEERFALSVPAKPRAVSVNRDGSFLAQFRVQDEAGELAAVLKGEPSGVARVAGIYRLLRDNVPLSAVAPLLMTALRDESLAVRAGVVEGMLLARNHYPETKALVRTLQEVLLGNLQLHPLEPIAAQLQEGCLTLLGELDDPDLYPLLHARLGHAVVDIQLGALAGVLRTSEPHRFAQLGAMLTAAQGNRSRQLQFLQVLAQTPDPAIMPPLIRFLSDTTVVARDDSSTPIRVFKTLHRNNRGVANTSDGVTTILQFVETNRDRPLVAAAALRALEGLASASAEVQREARKGLRALLKSSPPPLIASLAKQLL
ncbi:MAG: hypothetical protein HYV02_08310 [Deltaproteobacteria bacterium]|nr:hypothetical protein [Deltaproteobacteria bacterium]